MQAEPRLGVAGGREELWQCQEMRRALASRDLGTVFRLLQRRGVSQRRIAALTGMSSSEVYEVLKGRRVMAYDVLCRVADGLGASRGYLGLAYDEETSELLERTGADPDETDGGRALLAFAAEVTVGTAGRLPSGVRARRRGAPPMPSRIGAEDVLQLEAMTAGLRDLDYRFGGGTCCEPVLVHARRAERMCTLPVDAATEERLQVAVADAHNLAGWTAFDVGLYPAANHHLALALDRARQAGVPSLTANVLYRAGRVHLHRGRTHDALRFFQLGQLAAQDSGSHRTVAMLFANIAWAYAELGDAAQAEAHLDRSAGEFGRDPSGHAVASGEGGEPWAQFFTATDMAALAGMTQLAIAQRTGVRSRARVARVSLECSVAARGEGMARSMAFEQVALATACLVDTDTEAALAVGEQALAQARRLRSRRVLDRLRPFGDLAVQSPDRGPRAEAIRDLGRRVVTATSAS